MNVVSDPTKGKSAKRIGISLFFFLIMMSYFSPYSISIATDVHYFELYAKNFDLLFFDTSTISISFVPTLVLYFTL
jgi:hypothetical protein